MTKSLSLVGALIFLASLWLPLAQTADPKPEPVNLPFNTKADEDDPHINPDGRVLIYSSNAKGKYDLMMSQRASANQAWPAGKVIDGVQTEVDDRSAFLTTAGFPQFLYYASKTDKEAKNFDIYVAVRQAPGRAFAEPRALKIGTPEDEMHPWLANNGKELYFSRKTKDGWRVFVSTRTQVTNPVGFTEATLLDDLPAGFHHATLTPSGQTMYLEGPLDKGRVGLFMSKKTDKKWSKPELLDVNSDEAPTGDKSPCLSRDGATLYFASDRPGGKGGMDIWSIPVTQVKKKEK
jgi:hypothetical protein